jgi:hypothetical protein
LKKFRNQKQFNSLSDLKQEEFATTYECIAHSGYTGKQIQIVPSELAAATSDHLPIIFDFALT